MITGSCDRRVHQPSKSTTEIPPHSLLWKFQGGGLSESQAPLPTPYTLQHDEHIQHAEYIQHTEHRTITLNP